MEQTAQIKECAHTVAGIVAHVDAGKTTLAEYALPDRPFKKAGKS